MSYPALKDLYSFPARFEPVLTTSSGELTWQVRDFLQRLIALCDECVPVATTTTTTSSRTSSSINVLSALTAFTPRPAPAPVVVVNQAPPTVINNVVGGDGGRSTVRRRRASSDSDSDSDDKEMNTGTRAIVLATTVPALLGLSYYLGKTFSHNAKIGELHTSYSRVWELLEQSQSELAAEKIARNTLREIINYWKLAFEPMSRHKSVNSWGQWGLLPCLGAMTFGALTGGVGFVIGGAVCGLIDGAVMLFEYGRYSNEWGDIVKPNLLQCRILCINALNPPVSPQYSASTSASASASASAPPY